MNMRIQVWRSSAHNLWNALNAHKTDFQKTVKAEIRIKTSKVTEEKHNSSSPNTWNQIIQKSTTTLKNESTLIIQILDQIQNRLSNQRY